MDKLYTAGELAKLIGVTSRTVRYYDKKGILKPIDYSKGGYRLYDNNSAMKLQKIRMLQYAGLSLEDIFTIVENQNEESITEILWQQKLLLEQKRDRMNEMILSIEDALFVCKDNASEQSNMEKALDMLKLTNMESSFDYRFNMYEKYSKNQQNFHPWVLDQLELFPGAKVLDMGSGYGMIWVKNWVRIPKDTTITLVDVLNSGMDFFEKFYEDNKRFLQENVKFNFVRRDLENDFSFEEKYDRILANHLWEFIKEPDRLIENAVSSLKENGFFLSTVSSYGFMEEVNRIFAQLELEMDFVEVIRNQENFRNAIEEKLQKQFDEVVCETFANKLSGIKDANILLQYMEGRYPNKCLDNTQKWGNCRKKLSEYMIEIGELEIDTISPLYKCFRRRKC